MANDVIELSLCLLREMVIEERSQSLSRGPRHTFRSKRSDIERTVAVAVASKRNPGGDGA